MSVCKAERCGIVWDRYPVLRNAARCKLCGDEVESYHRHDLRSCSCGNITVDGGLSYIRRCEASGRWSELSEIEYDAEYDPDALLRDVGLLGDQS